MSQHELNPEVKEDVAQGNIHEESDIPLFKDTGNITVIVSTEHSVHVQMFEDGEPPTNLNDLIRAIDRLASNLVLEEIGITDKRPLVVHLNDKNLHFRTAAEIMCYNDGLLQMWEIIYDRNTTFGQEGNPNENSS